ncbi:glutamate racemase [Moraxella macacae 0408225]|uniref:Glutamate racemase n=1 Tax=Moraxella macacae 0408225 TaxID=1230338 RepID=L2F8I1_9GAMM|nr:glutamate racemase [Moraxella macacae]ELA09051.1 glutamate racemase [Moraxella macacae 0408225]
MTIAQRAALPIGVFDSGVGGLSVFAHLSQQLPYENYIYLADTLNVPYGSRQSDDIRELTVNAVDFLVKKGCKLVVIACNSASAYGLQAVREHFRDLPIVGLVPALKPAVFATKTKQVAVLATPATLHGCSLNNLIDKFATPNAVTVHKYSLASLVPWIESGMPTQHQAVIELEGLLSEIQQKNVDELVLGCTHFPFFKPYLTTKWQTLFADLPLHMIDSGQAVARHVKSLLVMQNLENNNTEHQSLQFFSTADSVGLKQVASCLLNQFDSKILIDFYQA